MEAVVYPEATSFDGSIPSGPFCTCPACHKTTTFLLTHGLNLWPFLDEDADWVSTKDRSLGEKLSLALYLDCLEEQSSQFAEQEQEQENQGNWIYHHADGLQKLEEAGLDSEAVRPVEDGWVLSLGTGTGNHLETQTQTQFHHCDPHVHAPDSDFWGVPPPSVMYGLPDKSSTPGAADKESGGDSDVENDGGAYGGDWEVPMVPDSEFC